MTMKMNDGELYRSRLHDEMVLAAMQGFLANPALADVEDVRRVDVIAMLLESLTPEQQEAVKAVLATKDGAHA